MADVLPITTELPYVHDEEMAQKVFQTFREREERTYARALKAWKARSHTAKRMLRMPDGTHIAYKIPTIAYHHWGKRYGYECWDDAGFVHEFLRDNPGCRVISEAVNPTILSGWAPSSKYAKAYRQQRRGGTPAAHTGGET